jgi:hypothetical protein
MSDQTPAWMQPAYDKDAASGGTDTGVPHSARVWNYWLGGTDNYAIDRAAGDAFREAFPEIVEIVRASRAFLVRAVEFLAGEAGIRQFLDVGAGLPTAENTHEVAHRVAPESRVIYVDNDPLVLVHARVLLAGTPGGVTRYIDADLREPDKVIAAAANTLDFTQPVALMLMGILGHIGDLSEARSIVKRLMEPLVSGSYLALNDGANLTSRAASQAQAQQDCGNGDAVPYRSREHEEIASFFEGLELVEPGLVSLDLWRPRPGDRQDELDGLAGVGRKP